MYFVFLSEGGGLGAGEKHLLLTCASEQLQKVKESFQHKPIGGLVSPDRDTGVFKWNCLGRSSFQNYDIETASISTVKVGISQNISLWLNPCASTSPKLNRKAWFAEREQDRSKALALARVHTHTHTLQHLPSNITSIRLFKTPLSFFHSLMITVLEHISQCRDDQEGSHKWTRYIPQYQ